MRDVPAVPHVHSFIPVGTSRNFEDVFEREKKAMANSFKKAVKREAKLRMSIAGPSGSGKTYTALTLAHALKGEKGVALIDTERGSASKYADLFPEFDVVELSTFSPTLFVNMIKEAEAAGCYDVLVIDSLSHAWNGTGGLLEIVDGIAKRKYQGNTFAAWKDATPLQNQLIDAITRSNLHIIATMRAKQEYALEKDERTNKTQPKKIGMAPIQRDGMEYEFDIAVDMDIDNTMIVQKSRCFQLSGQIIAKPTDAVADVLKSWLSGAPAPEASMPTRGASAGTPSEADEASVTEQQVASIRKLCQHLGKSEPANITSISYLAAKQIIQKLTTEYKEASNKKPEPASKELLASARQMYAKLGRDVPKDLDQKSAHVVRELLEQMTGAYRDLLNQQKGHASQPSQPTSTENAPDTKSLQKQCTKLGLKWETVVVTALKANIPDGNQTPEQQARIKQFLDNIEEQRLKQAIDQQKAS